MYIQRIQHAKIGVKTHIFNNKYFNGILAFGKIVKIVYFMYKNQNSFSN